MPVEMSTFSLPGGTRCAKLVSSGRFSKEDAEALLKEMNPGGSMVGMPRLVLTQQLTSVAPEARWLFAGRPEEGEREPWVAVVVSNPVVRVTTNFLVRINRNKRVRLFSSEPEATRWLDERIREGAARGT
jgi:hypothetical protein